MTLGERPRDPLTIPAPSAQDIARGLNSTLRIQAYTGDTSLIHEYGFLFSVNLRGLPIYLDSMELSKSLSELYTMADLGKHFVSVRELLVHESVYTISLLNPHHLKIEGKFSVVFYRIKNHLHVQ